MERIKTFLYACIAAGIVIFGIIMLIIGIILMIFAFIFIPIIWTLAKIGCPLARFDEREISLGRFIKLTFYPK